MRQEERQALVKILWELMTALTRLEAVAYSATLFMGEHGLEDEANELWDLYTVAKDWLEELTDWISNLAREREGGNE